MKSRNLIPAKLSQSPNRKILYSQIIQQTRSLVAVEPRRPPKTNVGTETASDTSIARISKKVSISEVRGQLIQSNLRKLLAHISTTSIYMLSVRDFESKGTISEVRVHAGAKFGHTGCWSIAKCSQRSRRICTGGFRSWPPVTCRFSTRRSFDHHSKGNGNFV